MIARALDAGVPCGWVLGDAVYGADRRLRVMLEGRGQPYLLGVRGNDTVWAELGRRRRPARAGGPGAGPARPGVAAAQRRARGQGRAPVRLGAGAAGPAAGAAVGALAAGPAVDRRSEDLAYFVVFGPAGSRLLDLARVAGRRWLVEECFEAAKQEVAWPTTRCGAGAAGTGTSPSPCWRSPSSPASGGVRREAQHPGALW
jgi:SRSO17 transposase